MNQSQKDGYFTADVWLMGGISIVVSLAFWLFVDRGANLLTVSQVAFTLAFVCNHPHFLSSYVMLYGDYRDRLAVRRKYAFAGIGVPLALAGVMVYALVRSDAAIMANVITAMYFLVGWHYVKQIFGCVIVTSVQRRIFFSAIERRLLLGNLFFAWFMSWMSSQVAPATFEFYGIKHFSLNLSPVYLKLVYAAVVVSLAGVVFSQVSRWIRTGQTPAPPAVAAFVSLYVWYIPTLAHPSFAYLIPFFHSLQYLAFVGRLKGNQAHAEASRLEGAARRRALVTKLGGFALLATGLGALSFEFVPKWMDSYHRFEGVGMGSSPVLAAVILFINIHHYFIDNVIWRSDNETVKAHLFSSGSPRVHVVTSSDGSAA